MDASELAGKMLLWEQKRKELDALEAEIESAVLAIGKTQTVGNCRATYNNPRKNYDYEAAAQDNPEVTQEILSMFESVVVDWKALCSHVGIKDVPFFIKSGPSVTLKLLS